MHFSTVAFTLASAALVSAKCSATTEQPLAGCPLPQCLWFCYDTARVPVDTCPDGSLNNCLCTNDDFKSKVDQCLAKACPSEIAIATEKALRATRCAWRNEAIVAANKASTDGTVGEESERLQPVIKANNSTTVAPVEKPKSSAGILVAQGSALAAAVVALFVL